MQPNPKTIIESKSRRIKGLRWAELQAQSPFPKKRVREAKFKLGTAYEKRVGRFLRDELKAGNLTGTLFLGQWIFFSDQNGRGWAQPDAYILPPMSAPITDPILLIESKLTQTNAATAQLISLYLPLLRKIYNKPIICLQICKNLRYIPNKFVESPQEVLKNPGPGVFTWHFPAL